MLINRISIVGVRGLVIFVLEFGTDGLFTTLNLDGFLQAIPAHGGLANEGIVEISGIALFGFLAPRTRFRGVMLREIYIHRSDLSRNGEIGLLKKNENSTGKVCPSRNNLVPITASESRKVSQMLNSVDVAWLRDASLYLRLQEVTSKHLMKANPAMQRQTALGGVKRAVRATRFIQTHNYLSSF